MRIASYIVLCSLLFAAWGPRAAQALANMGEDAHGAAPTVAAAPASVDGAESTPPSPAEEPEPQPQPQPQAEVEIEHFVLSQVELAARAPFAQASSPGWRQHLCEQSGVPRTHDRPPRR